MRPNMRVVSHSRRQMVDRVREHFLGPYRKGPEEILWCNTVEQVGAACGGAVAEEVTDGLHEACDRGFDVSRLPPRVAKQVSDIRAGDLTEVTQIVLAALDGHPSNNPPPWHRVPGPAPESDEKIAADQARLDQLYGKGD